jgi:hypothetical protein
VLALALNFPAHQVNVVATSYFKLFEIQLVVLMEDVKKLRSEVC